MERGVRKGILIKRIADLEAAVAELKKENMKLKADHKEPDKKESKHKA